MSSAWQWNQILGGQPGWYPFSESLGGEGTLGAPLPTSPMNQEAVPSRDPWAVLRFWLTSPSMAIVSTNPLHPRTFLLVFYEESGAWRRQVTEVTKFMSGWAGQQTHLSPLQVPHCQMTPPAAQPSLLPGAEDSDSLGSGALISWARPACLGPSQPCQLCGSG